MYQTLNLTAHTEKNDAVKATVLEMIYFSEIAKEKEKTINRINWISMCFMPDN